MNDRAELWYALENMHSLAMKSWGSNRNPQPLNAIFRPGSAGQFVVCLSRSRDQLSQWRAYGKRVGVAIAFDQVHLTHAAGVQHGAAVDCQYHRPDDFHVLKGEVDAIMQSLSKAGALNKDGGLVDMSLQNELTQRAVRIATSIKHPSFVEEQEIRLVFAVQSVSDALQFRSSNQSLTPYIKIDIDGRRTGMQARRKFANFLGMLEVMVWPSDVDDQILDAIDMLLSSAGHVLIDRSASPYRT
jgi:hypothetical protein